MGKTNRFLPPDPSLLQRRVPTARFLQLLALMLRLDPPLSSAFPSWSHRTGLVAEMLLRHDDDDDGGGVHSSTMARYESDLQRSMTLVSS